MMNVTIKRLWAGRVDIRSYDWEEAKRKGEAVVFHLDGKTMTIPSERLDEGEHRTKQRFDSKMGGQDYYLVSFIWKEDK